MKKNSPIYIVGHEGMLGQALLPRLEAEGFTNLLIPSQAELDLTDRKAVQRFFKRKRPEYCFLAPIKEGGIGANIAYPAELIYQNLSIQTNIIHASNSGVKKLLYFASSCVYPKDCPQPMKEEYLLTGPLEPTNESYAVAKIAGIKMCQAYNKQFGTSFISIIPATVYGPNDNFDRKTSHVIAALISKFHQAKVKGEPNVTLWGSGRSKREFIYVDDLAQASVFLMMQQDGFAELINVGTGVDITISQLAEQIKDVVGFKGQLKFDSRRPDGALRKVLDVSRLNSLGWKAKTDLLPGLKYTYRWYNSLTQSLNVKRDAKP